ncbi:MAG: CvpA family protein [Bacteroidetes bacterium]|nr:CvpA family protein [Bacteroidota bacterium]
MGIDIMFVIFGGAGFYFGYTRGIIRSIFNVLGIILGLVATFKFTPSVTRILEDSFDSNSPLMFLSAALIVGAIVFFALRFVAKTIENVLESVSLNFVNQILGGALTAAITILVLSFLIMFADRSNIIEEETKSTSVTYEVVEEFPTYFFKVFKIVKPIFLDFWDATVDFLDRVEDMDVERTEEEPNIFDYDEIEEDPN